MNKKTAGRISAMAMASMMMMSVCVVNASAEENEPITQLNLKKTVTTDGNTYQPNTSFSFQCCLCWFRIRWLSAASAEYSCNSEQGSCFFQIGR